ncbi:MAG: hypothetical protein GY698_10510 [Actinomycetia bacterium]|nr:hypothetical protein [Actinomycetes bacterium]
MVAIGRRLQSNDQLGVVQTDDEVLERYRPLDCRGGVGRDGLFLILGQYRRACRLPAPFGAIAVHRIVLSQPVRLEEEIGAIEGAIVIVVTRVDSR